jgi:hypothetical protein
MNPFRSRLNDKERTKEEAMTSANAGFCSWEIVREQRKAILAFLYGDLMKDETKWDSFQNLPGISEGRVFPVELMGKGATIGGVAAILGNMIYNLMKGLGPFILACPDGTPDCVIEALKGCKYEAWTGPDPGGNGLIYCPSTGGKTPPDQCPDTD